VKDGKDYVTIKLPGEIVEKILDPLVGTHCYSSRTDVIKDALRRLAEKYAYPIAYKPTEAHQ
jgi:Arc/MetJ-type ribon-helix-helix transcriptional regulator